MDTKLEKAWLKISEHFKPEDQEEMYACLKEIASCFEGQELLSFLEKLDNILSNIVVYEDMIKVMYDYKKLGCHIQESNKHEEESTKLARESVITFIVFVSLILVAIFAIVSWS